MTTGYTVSELKKITDLQGKDVVAIFGKTRAGKSTFINDVYGHEILKSTDSMASDTIDISYINEMLPIGNHNIQLVDTIGLGGSGDDHDTTHLSRKWIDIFHNTNKDAPLHPSVIGFLYFINISDDAGVNPDNMNNLDFFKELVGPNVLDSVYFVTTKWAPAKPKNKRRIHDGFFQEWTAKLKERFPGAHIIKLDDELPRRSDDDFEDEDPPMSALDIQAAKAAYHARLVRLLADVLAHRATVPTQTEAEINGKDGKPCIGGIGLGRHNDRKAEKLAKSLDDAGMPDKARETRDKAAKLASTKVADAGTISFTVQTVHGKQLSITLPLGTKIKGCKDYICNTYQLKHDDQYYSIVPIPMPKPNDDSEWSKSDLIIFDDDHMITDGDALLLRTDTYLGKKEITKEANRIVKAGGDDMLGGNILGTSTAIQAVGNFGIAVAKTIWDRDVYRQQLRMWKRADRKRRVAKERGEKVRMVGVPIGLGFQAASNLWNMGRNTVSGVLKSDLQDKQAEWIYEHLV